MEKCFNLWKKAIAPELLCKTMDKSDDDQNGEKKFCICTEKYDENRPMVGWDNCDS